MGDRGRSGTYGGGKHGEDRTSPGGDALTAGAAFGDSGLDAAAKIRILSHTHWDREWYLPSRYTVEWLGPFIDALLDRLDEDTGYRFSLDGQTILIEDFLEMCSRGASDRPFANGGAPAPIARSGRATARTPEGSADSPGSAPRPLEGNMDSPGSAPRPPEGSADSPGSAPRPPEYPHRSPGQARSALARYAREGRLTVGPYYQQPDWNLAGGEALIRNLLIGTGDAAALCEAGSGDERPQSVPGKAGAPPGAAFRSPNPPVPGQPVGWLPDNFGQTAQTVQIHRLFGISELVTWRGIGLAPDEISTELFWRAPDGSQALTVYLVDSYRNAMQLLAEPEKLSARIRWAVGRLKPFARTPFMLLLNGYDQEVEPEPIPTALRTHPVEFDDIRQVTLPEYVRELRAALGEPDPDRAPRAPAAGIPTIEGSQYDGRYISVFPGVLSARTYLKIANRRCETLLTRFVEPMVTGAWLSNGSYPSAELDSLWRKLLRNHPHDSLCGVSVDPVHIDMEFRYAEIEACALELIGQCAAGGPSEPAFFNPSPWRRRAVVQEGRRQRIIECPPLAPARIDGGSSEPVPDTPDSPEGGDGPDSGIEPLVFERQAWRVRSSAYIAELERDGTLTVTDRASGRRFSGLAALVDDGDAGDTYNHSPPSQDRVVRSEGVNAERDADTIGPYECVLEAKLSLDIPVALRVGRGSRAAETIRLPATVRYRFRADSPLIAITFTVDNRARDHRLRLHFPSDLASSEYRRETQYYIERTPIAAGGDDRSEKLPPHVSRVMLGAREREAIRHFPQDRFSFVRDDDGNTLAVFNRGLPEVEAIPSRSTLAITLLRSVGWLARPDLSSRIGDAGPMIYTPDAYCVRRAEFELAIAAGRLDDGTILRAAEEFAAPLRRIDMPPATAAGSLLSIDNPLFCLSALKRSESGEALVVRLWNSCDRRGRARLSFGFPVAAVRATGADETRSEPRLRNGAIGVERQGRTVFSVEASAWTIVTLTVEPDRLPPENAGETFGNGPRAFGGRADATGPGGAESGLGNAPAGCDVSSPRSNRSVTGGSTHRMPDSGGRFRDHPPLYEADLRGEYERRLALARERDAAAEALVRYWSERDGAEATGGHRFRGSGAVSADSPANDRSIPSGDDPVLAELRSRHSTLVRSALEAELSWVLNREKLRRWEAGELLPTREEPQAREEIRRIGNELNHARIAKRLDDYLLSMAREPT